MSWLVALLLVFALTACSAGSNDDSAASVADKAAPAAAAMPEAAQANTAFSQSTAAGTDAKGDQTGAAEDAESGSVSPSASETDTDTGAGGNIGAIADANAGYNRKMIYSATVVLKAESFAKAEEKVSNAIFQSQGFIVQFADTHNGDEIGSTYVIKVPSANFSSFLAQLGSIPNRGFDRQVQGSDVTEEYVDLQARLEAKQAVETRLLAFMDKATQSDDLVKFSNELGTVQEEIEQIKGRMRYLDQNVAYSTVNLKLYEASEETALDSEKEGGKQLGEKLGDALAGSARVLGVIGEGLLTFAAGLLPVLIVAAVIGFPVFWLTRKTRAARKLRATERRLLLNAAASASEASPSSAFASESESAQDPAPEGQPANRDDAAPEERDGSNS